MIFLESNGPGFLMNKFDALISIFIHPNQPRRRGEVSRFAQYSTQWLDANRTAAAVDASIRHRVLNEAPQNFACDRPTARPALHVSSNAIQFLPVVEVAVENDGVDSLRVANVFQRIGLE